MQTEQLPAVAPPKRIPLLGPARRPRRLGVHATPRGVDVAVVATHATGVQLCVLHGSGEGLRERRYALRGPLEGVWHGHLEGAGPGLRYGFRVQGPWDPDGGQYHNPAKLLLDPYGRGVEGEVEPGEHLYAHEVDEDLYPTTYPLARSGVDSLGHVPVSVLVDTGFDIAAKPRRPWNETVVYELHVKGFTKHMPGVPPELRGTYAGLAHPASVSYLQRLGVSAVELLPVHAKADEAFLTDRGLTNYWGYSTLSYFSPEPSYASPRARRAGAQAVVDEFRGMVSILHQAGIEVILDVVYNHTCEGGDSGPTLCWRGLDASLYYRHTDARPRRALDVTGTGNTLDFSQPRVVQMALDSLRYWSEQMGVDGFRFDLAATLGRLGGDFTPLHPFFVALAADPVLGEQKVIAEPWDVGPGGWQTGAFPLPFSEWNDRFRDSARGFWLADFAAQAAGRPCGGAGDLATRLAGSADLFHRAKGAERGVRASINYVASHDGFTLADLTTYDHKHNMANLESNHDGTDNNLSWNHGVEGSAGTSVDSDSHDASGFVEDIFFARERSQRNLLTTLFVSAGTPMLLAGDEFARTQFGNNNAYCQDSDLSWLDWNLSVSQANLLDTVRYLIDLRRRHPVLRPDRFSTGAPAGRDTMPDLAWFTRDAEPLPSQGWRDPANRVLQMLRSGVPYCDADALVVMNGTLSVASVRLPAGHGGPWRLVVDTSWSTPEEGGAALAPQAQELESVAPGDPFTMEPQSMQVYLSTRAARVDAAGGQSGAAR